jgi:hypothetical protein
MRCDRFGLTIAHTTSIGSDEFKKYKLCVTTLIERNKFISTSGKAIKWKKGHRYDRVIYVPPDQNALFRQHMGTVNTLLQDALSAHNASVEPSKQWKPRVVCCRMAVNEDE